MRDLSSFGPCRLLWLLLLLYRWSCQALVIYTRVMRSEKLLLASTSRRFEDLCSNSHKIQCLETDTTQLENLFTNSEKCCSSNSSMCCCCWFVWFSRGTYSISAKAKEDATQCNVEESCNAQQWRTCDFHSFNIDIISLNLTASPLWYAEAAAIEHEALSKICHHLCVLASQSRPCWSWQLTSSIVVVFPLFVIPSTPQQRPMWFMTFEKADFRSGDAICWKFFCFCFAVMIYSWKNPA